MVPQEACKISVIIPNYNGERYLSDCLGSLLEQSYKNLEIIVVDNGSSDASIDLVERNYSGVRIIRSDSNRGFSFAVNAGLRVASGEFVVLLNNDTLVDREFLTELHAGLRETPAAAMAAPKMLFARAPQTVNSLGLGYNITGTNHDIGFGLKDGPQFKKRRWVFGPCGGAGMYRRTLFEDVGLFDEDFFMYYEDVDFSFRAQLAGCRCISIPAARVYHAEGGSGATLPKRKNYYFARNSLTVVIKNFPGRVIFRNFHVISWEIIKRALSPLRRGDASALLGYFAALCRMRGTLRKRSEVQEQRKVPIGYIEQILKRNRSVLEEIDLRGRPAEEPS